MIEGLYVTVSPDGTIKKHLSTKDGEVTFPERSIAEELIAFSEQDYVFLAMHRKGLCCYACGDAAYPEVVQIVEQIAGEIKKQNILCGTLVQYEFWDRYHYCISPNRMIETALRFGMAFDVWAEANDILKQLSENSHTNLRDLRAVYITVTQYGKPAEYIFRSEAQYYYFLLQHLLESKIRICKCQFCGRFFAPRTKHKTLYCDNIIRNGKTCKEIAPYLKRKEKVAANTVLSQFEHTRDMMYHRFDRTGDDKEPSSVDITYAQYEQWLLSATNARNRYLAGELTEEEALSLIRVPTKQELLENNSSELTLANSGTQS